MDERYETQHTYSHEYKRSTSPIDYNNLDNKPSIENVTLEGNITAENLGLAKLTDIPTKTSDLHNDSGFITAADVPTTTSELTNDSGFITAADVPTKVSELDNDANYATVSQIPTKTSELTNDSGFITSASLPTKTSDLTNDSGFITSAALPTKTSDLTNDSGFITQTNVANNFVVLNWYSQLSFNSTLKNLPATIKTQLTTLLNTLATNEYITLEQVIITNLVTIIPELKSILKKGDTVPTYRLQGFSFGTNELVFVDVNNKKIVHYANINNTPAQDYNDDYTSDTTTMAIKLVYNKYKKGV